MFRNTFVNSFVLLSLIFISSCNSPQPELKKDVSGLLVKPYPSETYGLGLNRLSEYGFFKQPLNLLEPVNERVMPYELNAPLFTDYASKKRFIYFPEGVAPAKYVKDDVVLDFPLGTIIIKNFYYKGEQLSGQDKIIETRLLIHSEKTKQWETLPYVWNEEQTEAYLYILGKDVDVNFSKTEQEAPIHFTYSVPNVNMCKSCHINNKNIIPIGPSPMQLHRLNKGLGDVNQLSYMNSHQFLDKADVNGIEKIANYDNDTISIQKRAKAYLQANCAHCHNEVGSAKTSGLHLTSHQEDEYRIGINKAPIAAGQGSGDLQYGIVKGNPDASILVYRMSHTEPNIVMPEVGKNLVHTEGVALIREWIQQMK